MIILLLLSSLLPAHAVPYSVPIATPLTARDQFSPCDEIDSCRTRWDIIWSCLGTIFLCTYVSLHPNIPRPSSGVKEAELLEPRDGGVSSWKIHWRYYKYTVKAACKEFLTQKLPLFLVALFVPEVVLAWAVRQWLVAGDLAKETSLSRTHGFFIIMGGFHLYKRPEYTEIDKQDLHSLKRDLEEPLYPLDQLDVKAGTFEIPAYTEIQDKSKSDWLAKSIVLLQTSWFIAQCLARAMQRLPLTELELITLAYTLMNFGIYLAWWDKPYGVSAPWRVYEVPQPRTGPEEDLLQKKRYEAQSGWGLGPITKPMAWVSGMRDWAFDAHEEKMVPTFFSGRPTFKQIFISDAITLIIGTLFGAIHLLAWSFDSVSPKDRLLWRISSGAIAGVPALILVFASFWYWLTQVGIGEEEEDKESDPKKEEFWLNIWIPVFLIILLLAFVGGVAIGLIYIVGRIMSLVLAFKSLANLPNGAYWDVEWTVFIPHL